jgi:hypothetical protein
LLWLHLLQLPHPNLALEFDQTLIVAKVPLVVTGVEHLRWFGWNWCLRHSGWSLL